VYELNTEVSNLPLISADVKYEDVAAVNEAMFEVFVPI
jgi:hypothetical protein